MSNKNLHLAIYISAIMIVAGVFLPIASIPVYGEITYHRIDDISSYIIIVFALLAPVLVILSRNKLTFLCSCGIWLTLLYPAIKNMFRQEESGGFIDKLMKKAADPLQEYAIDLFLNITDFMWGGYIFIVGLLIFTLSSLILLFKSR